MNLLALRLIALRSLYLLGPLLVLWLAPTRPGVATARESVPGPDPVVTTTPASGTVPRKCIASAGAAFMRAVEPVADCQLVWGPWPTGRPGVEEALMLWSRDVHGLPDRDWLIQQLDKAQPSGDRYLLIGNECSDHKQCHTEPALMAAYWHDVLSTYPARIMLGGDFGDDGGIAWLESTMEAYRAAYGRYPRRAGFHFHIYPKQNSNDWHPSSLTLQDALNNVANIRQFMDEYGRPGDQVWVTEFGCLAANPCDRGDFALNYLRGLLDCFDRFTCGGWIDRYYFFTDTIPESTIWPWTWLHELTTNQEVGELTPIGELYRDWQAKPVWRQSTTAKQRSRADR